MQATRCLITGCALVLQHGDFFAWGDLHMQGDRFIFNGATDATGMLQWEPLEPAQRLKAIMIPVGEPYFERRGVLVCRASQSLLNPTALAYINSAPHGAGVPE